jgi:hypothetical protein
VFTGFVWRRERFCGRGEGLSELLELVAVKLAENMVDMQVGGWTRFVCG